MPIPEVKWSGGGAYSFSQGGFVQQWFYKSIGTIAGGLATQTPMLVAVESESWAAHNDGYKRLDLILSDGTVVNIPMVRSDDNGGLPTSWNGYVYASSDPRLNQGGTLRCGSYLVDPVGLSGDSRAGAIYAALLDITIGPGQGPGIAVIGASGPVTGATNPMPFSMSDPAPFLVAAMLAKRFQVAVNVDATVPGYQDVGSLLSALPPEGATVAIATYRPQTPPQLSGRWIGAQASGLWFATELRLGSVPAPGTRTGRTYGTFIG